MSRVEVANGIFKEQRLSRSYHFPSSSGHPYSMGVAAVNVPYEPNAHTEEYGNYHLHRREEDVKLVFGQDQNFQCVNYSPGESRPMRNMQPHIILQDHLKHPIQSSLGKLFPSPVSRQQIYDFINYSPERPHPEY